MTDDEKNTPAKRSFRVVVPAAWLSNPAVVKWMPIVWMIVGAVGGIVGVEIVTE